MKRSSGLLAILLMTPSLLTAQTSSTEPRVQTRIRVNGIHYDNFFQAQEGDPQVDMEAGRVEGSFGIRLRNQGTLQAYGRAAYTDYEGDLDSSRAVGVGLRSRGRPHRFDLFAELEKNRPTFDLGDEFEVADVRSLRGEYSFYVHRDWQLTGLGSFQSQDFEVTGSKDNDLYLLGGAVRFRGWGSVLSPEIGALSGERDADDPNEDHDQRDVWVKLRSAPNRNLYFSVRYRQREREYTIGDSAADNFRREDDRDQWVFTADIRTGDILIWNLYYAHEDADSTKDARNYTTQMLGLGVSIEF